MNKLIAFASSFGLMMFPLVASAQDAQGLITKVSNMVQQLIPLALAVALLVFFWGLIKYIWGAAGGEAKADGQKVMIAGIVGLFVMVSIWGIIGIIATTFSVRTGGTQAPPSVSR